MQPLAYAILVLLLTLAAAWAGLAMNRVSVLKPASESASASALGIAGTLTAVVLGIITPQPTSTRPIKQSQRWPPTLWPSTHSVRSARF